MAILCEVQGDYTEAQHFYQQVLSIRRKMMGYDNPKVLLTEASYAALLQKMGLDEEAARLEGHIQAMRNNTEVHRRLTLAEQ